MATRRQILLGAAGLVAAPYIARLERLAEPLEAYFAIPAETISVTARTGAYFRAGDILRVAATGENIVVRAISHDSISYERGVAA